MAPVTVLILAPAPDPEAKPLARVLDEARSAIGERHRAAFLEAGARRALVVREPPDGIPFGARLRRLIGEHRPEGLVVLGAGSIPLATPADVRLLVEAAGADTPGALANAFHSADVVAVACAGTVLHDLPPDLPNDNAFPRWIAEVAGVAVRDLRERRDLAVDVDSPLDLLLIEAALPGTGPALPAVPGSRRVLGRLDGLRRLATDAAAELLVAGRLSAADLGTLERGTRARTRALVEERGLRTAALAASLGRANRRPPRSLLAELLELRGPDRLGGIVAGVADGALIDTRVLLAARSGADEAAWPEPEDRYASDLLAPDAVRDPWLRELTAAAAEAPVPIVLGGHTLVGPGAPLALGIGPGPAAGS